MATLLRSYRGFRIKKTNVRDNTTYGFWATDRDGNVEWEADNEKECVEFIDGFIADREKRNKNNRRNK